MAEFNRVCARAVYYDIAFRRDIEPEVVFIADEYRRLNGRPLRSVLEIACGRGYHGRAFARQGVQALGLDLMPEMIEFARAEAEAERVQVEWMAAADDWQRADVQTVNCGHFSPYLQRRIDKSNTA